MGATRKERRSKDEVREQENGNEYDSDQADMAIEEILEQSAKCST